jgi:hypothetical protein
MTHYTISNCLLCYVIVVSKIKHTIYTAVVIMKCKKKKNQITKCLWMHSCVTCKQTLKFPEIIMFTFSELILNKADHKQMAYH